jgi:hypothetical protein
MSTQFYRVMTRHDTFAAVAAWTEHQMFVWRAHGV